MTKTYCDKCEREMFSKTEVELHKDAATEGINFRIVFRLIDDIDLCLNCYERMYDKLVPSILEATPSPVQPKIDDDVPF